MKVRLFVYSINKRTVSRTYGGSTYYYNVYEVKNNNMEHVADGHACTRGHKGEDSEAFGALIKAKPELKKMLIRNADKALSIDPTNREAYNLLDSINNSGGYYFRSYENFGLRLKQI